MDTQAPEIAAMGRKWLNRLYVIRKGVVYQSAKPGYVNCCARCVISGEFTHVWDIPISAFQAYEDGKHLQNAFSMLSVPDREFLLTGMSPAAFPKEPAE